MTTVPKMKLPDILAQFRKKDRAAGQGPAAGQYLGKDYAPIQPGDGKKTYQPVKPKGGSSRSWPFLVVIVVISILFGINDFIKDSEPFKIASSFVKENQQIKDDLGEVTETSPWFPSSLKTSGSTVHVQLAIRVEGKNGAGKAYVTLVYLRDRWQITAASYENRQGKVSPLIKGEVRDAAVPPVAGKSAGNLSAGHRFFKQNDFKKAVAEYDLAIQTDPNNSSAYYWRGRSYNKLNLPDKAVADFKRTVELNPTHTEAYSWLGWLAEKDNQYDACVGYLTKAIELKADNSWSYYHRGRCNYQQGNKKEAAQDADQACKLGFQQACKVVKQLKEGK
ncbi:MAG: cytochrome c oxidase assembly factor Coa1 family protein [Deltaproteobacteria bacterium]|nr:cytochrome c oxidase assembly factor Coa1 family protein [Deltaproteobacteria bacterium]